jgi:hypothetical protein
LATRIALFQVAYAFFDSEFATVNVALITGELGDSGVVGAESQSKAEKEEPEEERKDKDGDSPLRFAVLTDLIFVGGLFFISVFGVFFFGQVP